MSKKQELMMELIFWENYVDSTKLKNQFRENYCFQTFRNTQNSSSCKNFGQLNKLKKKQNSTNNIDEKYSSIESNKDQMKQQKIYNSEKNLLTRKNEDYKYDMDYIAKSNFKQLSLNMRFPQIKKKNSRITPNYQPLPQKILDQQQQNNYNLQQKFLNKNEPRKFKQNLKEPYLPKKIKQISKKIFQTEDTQKFEELSMTVTRLDNQKVKTHYPITQNDVTAFLISQKEVQKPIQNKQSYNNLIYFNNKKTIQNEPQNFDIKEFSINKQKNFIDHTEEDDFLYYMLKDKN